MNKPKVKMLFDVIVKMIEQLINTEKLRTSQLNRLGATINQLRKEINNES